MNWEGKKVLVTGAGGFIGSHLTEKLTDLGAEVSAFVHYNSQGSCGWLDESPAQDKAKVIAGDICDRDCVNQAMDDIQIVFHLAALIAIPYSYHAPYSYVNTNIQGTLNVLQAARERQVDRVIHTSTSEAYGTARFVPINESHPLQGQSPYSATKIAADKIVEAYHLSYGLPVVTIRPFNTFGPRQSARAIIPTIITQCLVQKSIKLGNLNPTRDFNYIANTVEGFILAASSSAAVGRTINIGSGREISIADLVCLISSYIGGNIKIEQDSKRLRPERSEVERLVADNTLARDLLGWTPSIGLERGLAITVDWLKQNIMRYKPYAYIL